MLHPTPGPDHRTTRQPPPTILAIKTNISQQNVSLETHFNCEYEGRGRGGGGADGAITGPHNSYNRLLGKLEKRERGFIGKILIGMETGIGMF